MKTLATYTKDAFMKKNDAWLILIGLFMAAAVWFCLNNTQTKQAESLVVIYKDGSVYKTLPLFSDEIITIQDEEGRTNVISIKDGKANMIEANCHDKLCVHARAVRKEGQSIVCLPNRVVIEIKGTERNAVDGVSE